MKTLDRRKTAGNNQMTFSSFTKCIVAAVCLMGLCLISGVAQSQSERKPQKVKFLIRAVSESDKQGKVVFRTGERILIKTLLKNISSEPLPRFVTDSLYQFRFQLWKVGNRGTTPYRPDKATIISTKEEEAGPGPRLALDPIPGGKSTELETFDLEEFYGALEPGQYKLTVFYRPGGEYRKEKIASNVLVFEILP